ncbi:MAG TPA: apolipoprotein N-acyltransferase, partial [Vicinamibacterales bacterium]|nr:apolipoprotein N-acyltransferase [Vicinamibacterales bacterium]
MSGALLALSFPKFGHPAFAWIALTPLIVALAQPQAAGSYRRAFLLGLLTGAVYFAGTLYWLVETMTTFGGLPAPVAIFVASLLVAYLSLFPAAFAVSVARLRRALGVRPSVMLAPAVWVATELGRQYVWDGFPWELLGYSQITALPVVQIASVVGVYGLSGLLALSASAAALVVVTRGATRWVVAAVVAVLTAGVTLWGQARLATPTLVSEGTPLRVAVLQGNIAQEDKWDPALRDVIMERYLTMTRQAIGRGARFVIWPESSTPFYFEEDLLRGGAIRRLARESGAALLIGSDQLEVVPGAASGRQAEARYYNAAFLVQPDGRVGAVYRKMHLVPFGEYVPLERLLFFVGPIVEAVSAFTPGDTPVLLPVADAQVSTAICYEVIYGSLMRRFVANGSQLLTTITNDAWYGRSSAAYQHWDQAAMRAIENGRYLARAANTGISGFVDPYGRVLSSTALFEQALLVQDVRL